MPPVPLDIDHARYMELAPGGAIDHVPGWIAASEHSDLLASLMSELDWSQPSIKLFGKQHPIPRMQVWIGDAEAIYRYSRTVFDPKPWHGALRALQSQLQQALDSPFNSVLANLYRDGQDCMHWHADDEAELGDTPCIASISLGATRDFLLRPRGRQRGSIKVTLGHGDLLVMRGTMQRYWQHSLPRRRGVTSPRINLTFRYVRQLMTD